MNDFLSAQCLSKEEKLFLSHVEDCIGLCEKNNVPRFLGFLDLRQQKIAEITARSCGRVNFGFFGGWEGCERKMFGAFPDYVDDWEEQFPISFICFSHSRELSHRDFLGALMSLGIKREIIGDILVGKDKTYMAVMSSMCRFILENTTKIGNVGVKAQQCSKVCVPDACGNFEELTMIVASLRLDGVIAALVNKSRSDSAKLISAQKVFVNHETAVSFSKPVTEGDIVSVRGYGKFLISNTETVTKKGRLVVSYKKYI